MASSNRLAGAAPRSALKPAQASKILAVERIIVVVAIVIGALGSEPIAIAIGLAFFAAGLPHGFLRGTRSNPRLRSAGYWAAYLLAAAFVLTMFLVAPIIALCGFLGLSLIHFASSDAHRDRLFNGAVGCLAVGGSALFQPSTTAAMFAAVAGQGLSPTLIGAIAIFGMAGVLLTLALSIENPRRYRALLLATGFVALLHPVLAVGAIFYLFHAAPIQRRAHLAPAPSLARYLVAAWAVLCVIGSGLALIAVTYAGVSVGLASATAIALVTPHLLEDYID